MLLTMASMRAGSAGWLRRVQSKRVTHMPRTSVMPGGGVGVGDGVGMGVGVGVGPRTITGTSERLSPWAATINATTARASKTADRAIARLLCLLMGSIVPQAADSS